MNEDFDYIGELELDLTTGLYNLFITTYNGISVTVSFFRVTRSEEMRLDKVSLKLFGTTRYVGTLCQLNDILNPYAIREGDVLAYCSAEQANNMMKVASVIKQGGVDSLLSATKRDLLDSYKKTKQDPARRAYLDQRGKNVGLPPTYLPDNSPQIVLSNNTIRLAPNLFNGGNGGNGTGNGNGNGNGTGNGNGGIGIDLDEIPLDTGVDNNPNPGTGATTELERVLIRRYIKKITP